MASLPSSGAISKAMSTNSMNLSPLGRMRQQRFSSRRACTAPCMNASIRQARIVYGMKIWPSLCGSTSLSVLHSANPLAPPAP
jgi:hypothetical protein